MFRTKIRTMFRRLTLTAVLGVFAALASLTAVNSAASARIVCSERSKFVEQLSLAYAENLAGLGLTNNGAVLEILVSKNGTWTILVTKPNGISCVVASGGAWQKIPVILAGEVTGP